MKSVTKEISKAIESYFDEAQVEMSNGDILPFAEVINNMNTSFDYDALAKSISDRLINNCSYTFNVVGDPTDGRYMSCNACGRLYGEWRNKGLLVEDHHLNSKGTRIIIPE